MLKRAGNIVKRGMRRACLNAAGFGVGLRHNERRLLRLRNSATGRRVFILGNGPSLLQTDVDRLTGEISIASNSIFLLYGKKAFRPTYYTIEDKLVAEDRAAEANALEGSLKIFPEDVGEWLKRTPNTLFVNFIRDYPDFPLSGTPGGQHRPLFSKNIASRAFWGGTVTYLNLQLAFHLGAKTVYMIGFDHNYARPNEKDQVEGSVITSKTDDINHFDPRYFGAGYRWHDPLVWRMERSYELARHVFERHGRKIYNATAGGKLEVFERVEFESIF